MSNLGNRIFEAQEVTTDGSWPRLKLTSIQADNTIQITAQYKQQYRGVSSKRRTAKASEAAGTIDNVVLTFPTKVDASIITEVMEYDPDNCYPYVVICPQDQTKDVVLAAGDFIDRVLINPTIDQLVYASSVGKGFSKGARGKTSGNLDTRIVAILQSHVHDNLSKNIRLYKPTDSGVVNEDLRGEDEMKRVLIRGEGKSISNMLNMTERFHWLSGKAESTHGGDLYDIFWSLPGTEIRWLSNLNKAPRHHAKAYVEFTPDEQQNILLGDISTVLEKVIFIPADETNLKDMNVKAGGNLGDYIINTIKKRL
jgi:hypothetical protein